MPRANNSVARHRKKNRLMRRVKGFRGKRGKLLKVAKETVRRADAFAFRHRRERKGEMRRLWTLRINAACRSRGIKYSTLIYGLKKVGVGLDRKILSDMAIQDTTGFDHLVNLVKKAG